MFPPPHICCLSIWLQSISISPLDSSVLVFLGNFSSTPTSCEEGYIFLECNQMPMLIMSDRRWHVSAFYKSCKPNSQACSNVQNCMQALTRFLLLQIRLCRVVDNVIQYNNHVECLDLHLSENYFELLPRDLTRDYIRQVLYSQNKGAERNEVCPTFISQK